MGIQHSCRLVCNMHKIKAVYLLFFLVTTASSSEEQVAERREDSSSQHIPTDKLQRRTLSWFTNLFSKGSGGSNNYYPYDYNQGHGGNYYGNTGTYGSSGYYPPSTYGETSYGSGFKPITYSGNYYGESGSPYIGGGYNTGGYNTGYNSGGYNTYQNNQYSG